MAEAYLPERAQYGKPVADSGRLVGLDSTRVNLQSRQGPTQAMIRDLARRGARGGGRGVAAARTTHARISMQWIAAGGALAHL